MDKRHPGYGLSRCHSKPRYSSSTVDSACDADYLSPNRGYNFIQASPKHGLIVFVKKLKSMYFAHSVIVCKKILREKSKFKSSATPCMSVKPFVEVATGYQVHVCL